MLQSRLFSRVSKEFPKDEESINARYLIRGGFINKVMAGVFNYLPLGLRVLNKINAIIREEMNVTGAEELHMSVLQNKDVWMATKRWESGKEVMFQFEDSFGKEMGLGWTHEEPLTAAALHFINSYKDLPRAVYQIQTKFRNEPRAKSGLLRGREFLMKDLYSFHADEADLNEYYEKVASAYDIIFRRMGLDARRTLASGGLFSKFSDEYQVLTPVGEDTIFYCAECRYAANKEVAHDLKLKDECPLCGGALATGKSVEVGNIFKLGTKFSEAFGLMYNDKDGSKKPVIMASYGIGPGRLLGTVVEVSHDERGIIWPYSIAPFSAHLLALTGKSGSGEEISKRCEGIYGDLQKAGIEVLYDDREDVSAGQKFAESDLIGIPWRAVISEKTGAKVEVKRRGETEAKLVSIKEFTDLTLGGE